jgi:hypothetical protein
LAVGARLALKLAVEEPREAEVQVAAAAHARTAVAVDAAAADVAAPEAEVVALVARDDGAGLVIWLHQRLFGAA